VVDDSVEVESQTLLLSALLLADDGLPEAEDEAPRSAWLTVEVVSHRSSVSSLRFSDFFKDIG
jgi:hypothetical protein